MGDDMKKCLQALLDRVDGAHTAIIVDRDGVPLMKVYDEKCPEIILSPNFLTTFATTIEQGNKLGLGSNRNTVAFYGSYQVICFNMLPIIIIFVANIDANTGVMLNLESDLQDIVKDLRTVVDTQLS